MKIRIGIFALFALMLAPLASGAVQRIRARPVLKADKEYNAILLHVAQYFVLTIPDGKTIDDIEHAIQCTFVIAPDGRLTQLEIENDTEGLGGMFAGAAARRTQTWLRDAVLVHWAEFLTLGRLDYLAVVDPESLQPLDTLEAGKPALMACAVRMGKARLLDNILLTL